MGIRNSFVQGTARPRVGVRLNSNRAERRGGVALALLGSALLVGRPGRATSGNVIVESIGDYSLQYPDHSQDTACGLEGDGFYNGIVNIRGLVQYKNYNTPGIVYDSDFYDPQLTHLADHDDTYFDRPG